MSPAGAVLLGLAAVGLVALLASVLVGRSRAITRLDTAARRLDPSSPSPVQPGIGPQVVRVERAAESALATLEREAEVGRRLARAIDAIPQGIVICDAAGDVVFRNAVGERFSGARHGEALVAVAVDDLLAQARGGERGQDVLELFGPPRRVIAVTAFPLAADPDGDPSAVGALVVIDDVSERRRLEQVRRDFVANISHELKTPVGALALLAETIVAAEDEETRSRLSERMLTEADRVGRTIDDLLSLSRIEAEGIPRSRVPASVVIDDAVARTRPAAELRDIAIHVDAPPASAHLWGDRLQLVSALYNLLENAVKFSEDGAEVHVVGRVDDRWIELQVVDHGVGIPARDTERIFERFYRVDRARSRETGGTGLGLAIVRHVMVNHDGEATVTSAEGEGSTFTLRVPAAPLDLEPDPRTSAPDAVAVPDHIPSDPPLLNGSEAL